MIIVEFSNEQSRLPIDHQRLRSSVHMICTDSHFQNAKISLAVVDDPTIEIRRNVNADGNFSGPKKIFQFLRRLDAVLYVQNLGLRQVGNELARQMRARLVCDGG